MLNIRLERTKLGWNQTMLANHLNVSKTTVTNWECDKYYPSIVQLKKMSTLFNCTIDYLLEK